MSTLPDLLDDTLCNQRIASIFETSTMECNGSHLIHAMVPLVMHMRRCGVMQLNASSAYPLAKEKSASIEDFSFSRCLSWRLLPVLRVVLSVQESSGSTNDSARTLIIEFLQALIFDELLSNSSLDVSSPKSSKSTSSTVLHPHHHSHVRAVVLRIMASIGRVLFAASDDIVTFPPVVQELYCSLLITIANTHDVNPPVEGSSRNTSHASPTNSQSLSMFNSECLYTFEMMQPQGNEKKIDTARRILAILEQVLIQVPVYKREHHSNTAQMLPRVLPSLASETPSLFSHPLVKSTKIEQNIRRSLAHSCADVAELSNRQSARSGKCDLYSYS